MSCVCSLAGTGVCQFCPEYRAPATQTTPECRVTMKAEALRDIYKRAEAADAKIARLRGLLKKLEWSDYMSADAACACPVCGNSEPRGHAPGCELAGVVEEGEGQ